MPVRNYALGTLNPIVYFEDAKGNISLPPTTNDALSIREEMKRRGYELREAGTLREIDRLQKRLQDQLKEKMEKELEHDEIAFGEIRRKVRDNLRTRMVSSSTSEYERDFIENYLMLREEKREEYQKRFLSDQAYFTMREYNASHHLQDLIDTMPEMKEDACKRCGRYRRARGEELCLGCLGATNG